MDLFHRRTNTTYTSRWSWLYCTVQILLLTLSVYEIRRRNSRTTQNSDIIDIGIQVGQRDLMIMDTKLLFVVHVDK